jgi:hypothetical protein
VADPDAADNVRKTISESAFHANALPNAKIAAPINP